MSYCYICGRHLEECTSSNHSDGAKTKDHIIPKSKGGSFNKSNIKLACRDCNAAKTNSLPTAQLFLLLRIRAALASCGVDSGMVSQSPDLSKHSLSTPNWVLEISAGEGRLECLSGNVPTVITNVIQREISSMSRQFTPILGEDWLCSTDFVIPSGSIDEMAERLSVLIYDKCGILPTIVNIPPDGTRCLRFSSKRKMHVRQEAGNLCLVDTLHIDRVYQLLSKKNLESLLNIVNNELGPARLHNSFALDLVRSSSESEAAMFNIPHVIEPHQGVEQEYKCSCIFCGEQFSGKVPEGWLTICPKCSGFITQRVAITPEVQKFVRAFLHSSASF